ncbi:hypothetical protein AXA51_25025 (plasmid) [Enterobacter hormaechei]|nr:hypothetical protein AXA51_25025 [Enterobacter hormaechei]
MLFVFGDQLSHFSLSEENKILLSVGDSQNPQGKAGENPHSPVERLYFFRQIIKRSKHVLINNVPWLHRASNRYTAPL